MDQQSTSKLPPLPEDTVEEKRRQSIQNTPGNSPSEPTLPRHIRPEDSPISPTPGPRATSTPETNPRINNIPRQAFFSTPNNPSPFQQQVLKQERIVVKIKAKDYNLNFNGEEVKKCIKKAERIAQIEGATDEDLAMQMAFWTTDPRISGSIKAMPRYEEVEPKRRYRKDSLIQLFSDTQDEGGIRTLSEYKKFIGEYETIITYLLRYKYIPQENMFHEDVFDCLSSDIKGTISKEMIKDNVMVRAEDGGYLIPPMRILKKYIEQELEARILVTKRLSSPRIKTVKNESITKENNVKFKEELFPGMQEALKKMKELTKSLKEQQVVVNKEVPREKEVSKQFMEQLDELSKIAKPQKIAYANPQAENSGFRPKENLPPASSRYVPYAPAQNAPKQFVRCYYCSEEGHSTRRFNELIEDQNKKWVIRQGFNYLYPNWARISTDGELSPKQLVREFQKEQEELKKKLEEKAKEEEKKNK
ncbi:hypothetical protein O181_110320 [Austropuccinia psidii MF-1]|uniref:Uncharacterized protein n=1 Tax=Austropuccinia psidii MF-1 TaxID=1389203 RepID=A0A9Q3PRF0_9BASI|nr:hypothetical protein [Austropuccinia psidii MF-1]